MAELPEARAAAEKKNAAHLERGYSIRTNGRLRKSQASALRAPVSEASFPSRERTMDVASMVPHRSATAISMVHSSHDLIARFQDRLSDPEQWKTTDRALLTGVAASKDMIEAERMKLDAEAGNMRMMLGVTKPAFHEAEDGTLHYAAYEPAFHLRPAPAHRRERHDGEIRPRRRAGDPARTTNGPLDPMATMDTCAQWP